MTGWIYVSLTYATFRLEVINNRITVAAPIVSWTKGRQILQVKEYFSKKNQLLKWEEFET